MLRPTMGLAKKTRERDHSVWGKGFGLCPSQNVTYTQERAAFDLFRLEHNAPVEDAGEDSAPYPRVVI